MDDFEKELKLGFLEEASQAVADVEQCFLALESNPNDLENLNKIFRLAHNLKGSSKAVGFAEFGAFTHEFETFILKIKNGELQASPSIINLLLRSNDFVLSMIENLKKNLDATFDFADLLAEMKNPPTEDLNPLDAEIETLELADAPELQIDQPAEVQFIEKVSEVTQEQPIESKSEIQPVVKSEEKAKAAKAVASPSATPASVDESLRVSLSKVESLINFVGEMVILQTVLKEQARMTGAPLLIKTVHQLEKVGKEIQETSMSLRMTPIKPTFQKMVRIVRDTAQALNKDVQLVLEGEETEVDKTVLEKINDPLVHLIRNAVDHGIETKEKRLQAGKSEKGRVLLKSFHQSGRLIIEVRDDGGGLNPDVLIKKAQSKGLLKPGLELKEKEAYQLIFAPGFSTKEQVTDVSGRGVGMDVVKTNIQEIGGEVQIESKLGEGTVFRIILPLTLAIIDAMVVSYADSKFVIPLNHVHETVPTRDHVVQNSTSLGDILLLRGENLRLIRLGDFFSLKTTKSFDELITIVIRTGPEPIALAVDDILGQYQVVLKQLGPELQGMRGITGSTILGDGKPALILEPVDLLKRKIIPGFINSQTKGVKSA